MVNGAGNLPNNLPEIGKLPPIKHVPKQEPKFIPKPEPKVEPAAQVTLSARARETQSLTARVQATPEVRPGRVEEARAKISKAGGAQATNAKIAEKLLTEN